MKVTGGGMWGSAEREMDGSKAEVGGGSWVRGERRILGV